MTTSQSVLRLMKNKKMNRVLILSGSLSFGLQADFAYGNLSNLPPLGVPVSGSGQFQPGTFPGSGGMGNGVMNTGAFDGSLSGGIRQQGGPPGRGMQMPGGMLPLPTELKELCPAVQSLKQTSVGKECWAKLWVAVGCLERNLPEYEIWHSHQSLEILLEDVKQWATLTTPKHREACYGDVNGGPAMQPELGGMQQQPPAPPKRKSKSLVISSLQNVQQLEGFLAQVGQSQQPVVFNFGADSCPFCVIMEPVFDLLAEKFTKCGLKFVNINVQQIPESGDVFQVQGMPAFRGFYKNSIAGVIDGADTVGLENMVLELAKLAGLGDLSQRDCANTDKTPSQSMPLQTHSGEAISMDTTSSSDTSDFSSLSNEDLVNAFQLMKKEIRKRGTRSVGIYTASPAEGVTTNCTVSSVNSVIIAGAGPAGLSAALYAARAGLCPIVIAPKLGGGQLFGKGVDVENYPGIPRTTGAGMIQDLRLQCQAFDVRFVDAIVKKITKEKGEGIFSIQTGSYSNKWLMTKDTTDGDSKISDDGIQNAAAANMQLAAAVNAEDHQQGATTQLRALSVIYATGAETKWLGVPGEYELRGKGISSCANCDGFLYRNKICHVIGGGDTAMEETLFLSRICKSPINIIVRKNEFKSTSSKFLQKKIKHLVDIGKVQVLWGKEVKAFNGSASGDKLLSLALRTGETLETDAAFIAIGHDPNTKLLKKSLPSLDLIDSHVRVRDGRECSGDESAGDQQVQTGELAVGGNSVIRTCTSVAGFFVAGDVADAVYRQAIISAATGAAAAMEAEKFLQG